jgi:hypothetical protein
MLWYLPPPLSFLRKVFERENLGWYFDVSKPVEVTNKKAPESGAFL